MSTQDDRTFVTLPLHTAITVWLAESDRPVRGYQLRPLAHGLIELTANYDTFARGRSGLEPVELITFAKTDEAPDGTDEWTVLHRAEVPSP